MTYLIFKNRKYCLLSISISAAIFLGSASLNIIAGTKTLKIALLGKNDPGVIIVSKGRSADLIDINGNAKNCRYAVKYLKDNGISKLNSVVLTAKPQSAMSSYNSGLSFYETENVILPSGTYIRQGTRICGCCPKYSDFTKLSADYGKYTVSFTDNNIYADYGSFHFSFNSLKYPANTVIYAANNGKYKYRRLD